MHATKGVSGLIVVFVNGWEINSVFVNEENGGEFLILSGLRFITYNKIVITNSTTSYSLLCYIASYNQVSKTIIYPSCFY
jgi:hypothetical protein